MTLPTTTLRSEATDGYILSVQHPEGMIPWHEDGPTDPWNHVESAMGLSVAGRHEAAEAAYDWLRETQMEDGGWWAAYDPEGPADISRRETHMAAYVATGVWHHYRVTSRESFLRRLWPTVRDAIEFTLRYQAPSGEIYWALTERGDPYLDALVTACSSIYKSLSCAVKIAGHLGVAVPGWWESRKRLGDALRNRPHRFDRTWESKHRYAMDWFYPVLSGVLTDLPARTRMNHQQDTFLVEELGCLCVADEPWVTVAESCELVMALLAVGKVGTARRLFGWLDHCRDDDGGFWTGYQYEKDIMWPREKPTWTAGAVLLAADALESHTEADDFFTNPTPPAEITNGQPDVEESESLLPEEQSPSR